MPSTAILILLASLVVAFGALLAFMAYLALRYAPIVGRIFEEKPLFLPLRVPPRTGGEDVRFLTSDGLELAGSYFPALAASRVGVVVFCHEFLSDRWSFQPYADPLLACGFDVFSFDFRNHGESDSAADYHPLQWVSDHEVRDLRAALDYLRSRPDRDPAGVGLFGVSRGGGTALLVAADDPSVWGVASDGAFPTRGTMGAYIRRWAEIYISTRCYQCFPSWVYTFVGWAGRVRSEKRLGCRFPSIERAVAQLAPRPWLMIHGAKDTYIGPEIAQGLFTRAGEPKELWLVPDAKHNRCRELHAEVYAQRVGSFFGRSAPRRALAPPVTRAAPGASRPLEPDVPRYLGPDEGPPVPFAEGAAAPVSG